MIKRILGFCLPILLFTACGEEDNNLYKINPVVGVWNNYYQDTDSLVMIRVFTPDYYSYFIFSEGKVQNELNKQHYVITEKQIILEKYTQNYTLDYDTLWITNSKGDQKTKYIRVY